MWFDDGKYFKFQLFYKYFIVSIMIINKLGWAVVRDILKRQYKLN